MAKHTLSIQSEYLNKLKFLLQAIQFVFYFVLIWLHWITGSILVKNMLPHSTGQKIRRHNYALSVQDWCYNTAILNVTVTENIVSMKEGITEAHGGHWWKNASCALTLISKFVLLLLGRYLCVWTICPRVYHPPSSQCLFNLSFVWTRLIYYIFWKSREAIPVIHFWWFNDGINLLCMQRRNERSILVPSNNSTWYTPYCPFPIHGLSAND